MSPHRFQNMIPQHPLPQPNPPQIALGAFVLCPLPLLQGLTAAQQLYQWSVYRLAFEKAQAVVRPSLPERDLLGVWN